PRRRACARRTRRARGRARPRPLRVPQEPRRRARARASRATRPRPPPRGRASSRVLARSRRTLTMIAEPPVTAAPRETMGPAIARDARPRELAGWTWRIDLEGARLYLVVNHDGVRVVEVFVSGGPLSPSVGLLASKMLQRGFTVRDVARLLDKVTG